MYQSKVSLFLQQTILTSHFNISVQTMPTDKISSYLHCDKFLEYLFKIYSF